MGKLFIKEYHENSSLWYFKTSIIPLKKEDIIIDKFIDEKHNIILKFFPSDDKKKLFPATLDIIYDSKNKVITYHNCSICNNEDCPHYFSILEYAYNFLTIEDVTKDAVKMFRSSLLEYHEYWQQLEINGKIEVKDLYNPKTNKVRFYFSSYNRIKIKIIAEILADKLSEDYEESEVKLAKEQMKALTYNEKMLLKNLQLIKASYSKKNMFFSVYKNDMEKIFPFLKNLSYKTYIKETGEKLIFSEDNFVMNFYVIPLENDLYLLKNQTTETISALYFGHPLYVLKQNVVHRINLPFKKEVLKQILESGLKLSYNDLIYLYTVVTKQLGLIGCHIDFNEKINLPQTYRNKPVISFDIYKENENICVKGNFKYDDNKKIPMSIVRINSDLFCCEIQKHDKKWFYLPPEEKYLAMDFIKKLPVPDINKFDKESLLIYSDKEKISLLKQVVFEHTKPEWEINLSDELKKEFVFKVKLAPKIIARKTDSMNWFEYEVIYNYKDIKFSHNELKRFFKSNKKYLELKDGKLIYFENKEAFDQVEKVLKRSKKLDSTHYRMLAYNIPYLYQLKSINNLIETHGDQALQKMFSELHNRSLQKEIKVPEFLNGVMRSYQKSGFRWLVLLNHYNFGGILADDMGLGKTLQTISLLSILPSDATSLVVCPKTLLYNWADEIEKFNKSLTYLIYDGPVQKRKKLLKGAKPNIILISYSMIINDVDNFKDEKFYYIILDESQYIKNPYTMRSTAIKKLNGKHKLCLTGTPIQNNPIELWSLFDFLMPGFLPSLRNFKNNFINPADGKGIEILKKMIAPFILRRTKESVLMELPDKQVQTIFAKPSPLQEKLYLQALSEMKSKNIDVTNPEYIKRNYINILSLITKLRLISNHPHLVDKNIKLNPEFSGKTEALLELIEEALASNRKILIFSQFVKMLNIIKSLLKKKKIPFLYMDGSTQNRKEVIDEFNTNNKIRIFLVSLKTGGYGINLTSADTVIIVDPWWNPMEENQAIDRAHRMGQTKKVIVYKLITKGTIEEKILQLQKKKWDMFDSLINDGQNVFEKLTPEDIRDILEYNE